MPEPVTRREVLRLAGCSTVAGLAGLAGCSQLPGSGGSGGGGGGSGGWANWRGSADNAGRIGSSGPSPDATSRSFAVEEELPLRHAQPPVVGAGGDGIYATSVVGSGETSRLVALAYETDGTRRWQATLQEYDPLEVHVTSPHYCLGPDALFVYWYGEVLEGDERTPRAAVAAVDRASGETTWTTEFDIALGPRRLPPAFHDGVLYLFHDRRVVALDPADGSERWRSPAVSPLQSVPTVGEGTVAVFGRGLEGMDGYGVAALNSVDGSVRWSIPSTAFSSLLDPVLSIHGDTLFVVEGSRDGSFTMSDETPLAIHAFDLADGSDRWQHTYVPVSTNDAFSPRSTWSVTVAGDHVYYALASWAERLTEQYLANNPTASREDVPIEPYTGPNIVALNASDGSVAWETTLGERAQVFAPLAADGDHLYVVRRTSIEREEARVHVLDRSDGSEVGSFGPIPDRINPLAMCDGSAYVQTEQSIEVWS